MSSLIVRLSLLSDAAIAGLGASSQAVQSGSVVVAPLWLSTTAIADQVAQAILDSEPMLPSMFTVLNTSRYGVLISPELRPLADLTGLIGSDAVWVQTFCVLCQSLGCAGAGINCSVFARMLRDPTRPCYCPSTDALLALLQAMRAHFSSRVGGVVPHVTPVLVAQATPLFFQRHPAPPA